MPAPMGHPPYNTEGEGGRPVKYTKEVIEKYADELLIWLKNKDNIFFEEFSLDHDIHPEYMSRWAQENERFYHAYTIAHSRQEQRLKKGALIKDYDSGFTKFLLINNHGYADKTQNTVTVKADDANTFVMSQVSGTSKDLVTNG